MNMKKPVVLDSTDNATTIWRAFGTPLVVKGITWFPLAELIAWGIMAWVAGKRHPDWNWGKRIGTGALTSVVVLGSEWCHNLAHAGAARWIGKPMDAMRIAWGMPLVVYYNLNDQNVAPRQHISRALGGPLFNAAVLPFILLFRRFTPQGSVRHEVADAAAGMNLFLCTVSLLPIPGIDGGPVLKWSLVESGHSVAEADGLVKKADLVVGAGLGVAAGLAMKRRRNFLSAILGMFAALALAVGFGLIKEE
jgi:Zn-dependent protease